MTPSQAAELLELLTANYPRTDIGDATTDLWLAALGKLDRRVGELAVEGLLASIKTWPSIAHLNEQVAVVREQLAREHRAAERRAAEEAYDQMPRVALKDIPEAVELLNRIASPVPLDQATDGDCDDRCGRTGVRYRIGRVEVCAVCARQRLGAAGRPHDQQQQREEETPCV